MSPVASGGPSHARVSSVNGGGPVGTTKGTMSNGIDGMRGANRVFPHLDDLVSVVPNVDINSPIRRILQDGELFAKQADTHLDFRRPDIALQEYVKASIVAVDIIPRHKDYTMLQADRGELHRQYAGLKKRINAQHSKFAEVKQVIKENNARSGMQPTIKKAAGSVTAPKVNGVSGHTRSQSVQQPPVTISTNGNSVKQKPPIQPKPENLHGNALPATQGSGANDLATRLARLRSSNTNGAAQDPRIRTQSISVPPTDYGPSNAPSGNQNSMIRPLGPRDMPSVPTTAPRATKLSLDMDIPGLPRPPDAIYNSPARNSDNTVAANLPSSVARTPSYQGAAPPISTVGPTPGALDRRPSGEGYFYQHTHSASSGIPPQKQNKMPHIPDSTTVSAEELMEYLKVGSRKLRVLLVDVRSREDFENGHIMSQSIICVEPITLRKGISGEQLGDSMVIAPDSEQQLYEQREEFDLVVFYNQSSSSVKYSGTSSSEDSLYHFSEAVYEYGYEKKLKRRPVLLVGGLDAWIDLLGPNSLKASVSRTSSPAPNGNRSQKPARSLGLLPPTRNSPNVPLKRRKTHSSRPLSKEQEARWDQTLREDFSVQSPDEHNTTDELVYAKTTEDFFRKYPELPPIQESMISPPPKSHNAFHDAIAPSVPAPPARPAPALPRQRSSGLSEKGPFATVSYAHSANNLAANRVAKGLTGLTNPNVQCYMNAALQAISATPFLRHLLLNFRYPPPSPLPRKGNEATDPPQLMVRCLGNVFGHLWSGNYNYITPRTFCEYVNSVHAGKMTESRLRSFAYGGSLRQHDSGEFMLFLLEILDDELNPRRNIPPPAELTPAQEAQMNQLSVVQASKAAWTSFTSNEDSIITQRMKGQITAITTCDLCHKEVRTFQTFSSLPLPIPSASPSQSLEKLICSTWGGTNSDSISNYTCPHCNLKDVTAQRTEFLSVLPDYLVITILRYDQSGRKISTPVNFPEYGLNITRACLAQNTDEPGEKDLRRTRPFLYDSYASIIHNGESTTSGHYFTFCKNPDKQGQAGQWNKFNDSLVENTTFSKLLSQVNTNILFKRQGSPIP